MSFDAKAEALNIECMARNRLNASNDDFDHKSAKILVDEWMSLTKKHQEAVAKELKKDNLPEMEIRALHTNDGALIGVSFASTEEHSDGKAILIEDLGKAVVEIESKVNITKLNVSKDRALGIDVKTDYSENKPKLRPFWLLK